MFETTQELGQQLATIRIEMKHLQALNEALQSREDKRQINEELYGLGQKVSYLKYKMNL